MFHDWPIKFFPIMLGQQHYATPFVSSINYSGSVQYMEHVIVKLTLKVEEKRQRGDITVNLTSRSGNHQLCLVPVLLVTITFPYVINEVISKAKANNSTNPEQPFFLLKKKELPWVGFEPTTLCFLGMSALPTELPGQLSR